MIAKFLIIELLFCATTGYSFVPTLTQIGGIFEGADETPSLIFKTAIEMIFKNTSKDLMRAISFYIDPDEVIDAKQGVVIDKTWRNPITTIEGVCWILKQGVMTIFSLLSEENSNALQSLCDTKEIPVIQITPHNQHKRECCSINLHPHAVVLGNAFTDLLKRWGWKNFTILYEEDESLTKIVEILKDDSVKDRNVILRQLKKENGNFLKSFKVIRRSRHSNYVLDCSTASLNQILQDAQETGLMGTEYQYAILNLDLHTIDTTPYQHTGTNITTFRLVNLDHPFLKEIQNTLFKKRKKKDERNLSIEEVKSWKPRTVEVLCVDAMTLFSEIFHDHPHFQQKPLFCNTSDSWEHGSTIYNFMKTKMFYGLTGWVEFDQKGFRTDFSLDAVQLTEDGFVKIGTWDTKYGLTLQWPSKPSDAPDQGSLRNMSFNVAVTWAEPYTMYKDVSTKLLGNDQFEGYAVDVIKELALQAGFNYTIIRNEDDLNGSYNKTSGKWNGIIGDVLEGRADLAISDLTITRERKIFVDFTSPFMSLGVQILYKKPEKSAPSFFAFAEPFGEDVWFLMGATFFAMSGMFYVVARLCPTEWYNPYPCLEQPLYLVNQYDIGNCFWLITANLMQNGADTAPRGISTRVLTSIWAFFILIMLSTYTANMAAFLTAEKDVWEFTDVRELVARAEKAGITYGAATDGATHKLFKESDNKLYQKIASQMKANPEFMVSHYELGIERVKEADSKYAFFMESSTIKYTTERQCNLTAVGPFLDQKFYGIAMRKGSPYRNSLSAAMLKLQESGKLDELERKWWQKERGGGECGKRRFESAPPLYIQHVAGIMWITFGGVVLACGIVFIELACYIFKKFKRNRCREFAQEFKLSLRFEEITKPTRKGDDQD